MTEAATFLLGIDVGTGGTRALVINERGQLISSATEGHEPFASPRIGWAEQHIAELKQGALEFFRTNTKQRVAEFQPDTGYVVDKSCSVLRFLTPSRVLRFIPLKTCVPLLTMLHLRWSRVLPIDEEPTFPLAIQNADVQAALRSKCKHVPDEIKSLFCSFKPYKRGNPPLWALNRLCNASKHRDLVIPGFLVKDLAFPGLALGVIGAVKNPRWNRRKNEIIISKTRHGTFQHDVEYSIGVTFGKVPFFGGKPVLAGLRYLTSIVKGIVMATEAEARRIGIVR